MASTEAHTRTPHDTFCNLSLRRMQFAFMDVPIICVTIATIIHALACHNVDFLLVTSPTKVMSFLLSFGTNESFNPSLVKSV